MLEVDVGAMAVEVEPIYIYIYIYISNIIAEISLRIFWTSTQAYNCDQLF